MASKRVARTLPRTVKQMAQKAVAAQQEQTFLDNLRAAGGLPPAPFRLDKEFRFHPIRKWRFDYAYPEQRVAVEKDGGIWVGGKHGRGSGIVKDHEKQNHAAVLGWRILRCTPKQLTDPAFAEMVVAALHSS